MATSKSRVVRVRDTMMGSGIMTSRVQNAESTYDVARQWVDQALLTDDSLFSPGTPIWTHRWLDDLHKRFLEQPAVSQMKEFWPSLKRQLEGSEAEVHQLMAETLFVHLLIQYQNVRTKRNRIQTILSWHPDAMVFPDRLNDGLAGRLVNAEGGFGSKFISYQVGTLIESVVHLKNLTSYERQRLIQDPWEFKDFLFTIHFTSPLLANNQDTGDLERHMLLHIVHPETFEPMLGNDKSRVAKAKAFQQFVPEPNLDTDRAIKHIREGLERKYEKDFSFYNSDIRKYWKPEKKDDPLVEELENGNTPSSIKDTQTHPNGVPQYTICNIISDGCFIERSRLEDFLEHWSSKKNLILQGPPGTGKTWLARKLAYALIGRKDESKVESVQFHANLSYEDFVRGWRPSGEGSLDLVDGPFLRMVETARDNTDERYVIVIEEINRGNPAQIFGEMLTLMEADKRGEGEALGLSYRRCENEQVYVPENLYVIGTMNIADRSLALVDLAFRRRFAFEELQPELGQRWLVWVHEKYGVDIGLLQDIRKRLLELNQKITDDRTLGRQFRIGHSYVTPPLGDDVGDGRAWFRRVVEMEIGPLLVEYWYDSPETAQQAKSDLLQGF